MLALYIMIFCILIIMIFFALNCKKKTKKQTGNVIDKDTSI